MLVATRALHARAVAAAMLFLGGSAIGADLAPEGAYDVTSCWSGASNMLSFSKTHVAFTYEMTGTTRAAQPGGLFDKTTFRCIGLNRVFEGKLTGNLVCEGIDKDGHKALATYEVAGGSALRTQVAGTGKYEGMTMVTNPTRTLGPFPTLKQGTFQSCNQQTGTYKLMKTTN